MIRPNEINVTDLTAHRALVTRATAREVARALLKHSTLVGEITLDFNGVSAAAPAFLDELIGQLMDAHDGVPAALRFRNLPTTAAITLQAIGHGRNLSVEGNELDILVLLRTAHPAERPGPV